MYLSRRNKLMVWRKFLLNENERPREIPAQAETPLGP